MVPDEARGMNLAPVIAKELDVRGAFRFVDEIDDAIALLARSPQIEEVITHEFAFADAVPAFEAARDSDASGKVIITLG